MYIYYILYIHICIHIYTYYAYIHIYIRAVQPDPNPAKPGLIRAKISPILAVRWSMAGGMFRYLTLPSRVSVYPFRDPIPTEASHSYLFPSPPLFTIRDLARSNEDLSKSGKDLTKSYKISARSSSSSI